MFLSRIIEAKDLSGGMGMYSPLAEVQHRYEYVSIDDLVADDHPLRVLDKNIDFSFIDEIVKPYYSQDNGRPCIKPVLLIKMMLIGYLFGIRSERRLVAEVYHNTAYRWFLGLGLEDSVPHHSTLSQNRRRRFNGTEIFQEIFDRVVEIAIEKGLIGGHTLFTDSTFLKANANRNNFTRAEIKASTKAYASELDKAVEADRIQNGKDPLPEKEQSQSTRTTRVSNSDPESGYMLRKGKPEGFFYLDHRTVDSKYNIITDVYVTPGNVHDSVPYVERLQRQIDRFEFDVQGVALDSGYLTAPICHFLVKSSIFGVIAHRRFRPDPSLMSKMKFVYNEENNCYHCPEGHILTYRTTNREGYREYRSNPKVCANCPLLSSCTKSKNHVKTITRHIWQGDKEKIRENRLSENGKILYARRKETVERSFADSKELHGLRYCRMRGQSKVREQCLLTATSQNLMKIARCLEKKGQRVSVAA